MTNRSSRLALSLAEPASAASIAQGARYASIAAPAPSAFAPMKASAAPTTGRASKGAARGGFEGDQQVKRRRRQGQQAGGCSLANEPADPQRIKRLVDHHHPGDARKRGRTARKPTHDCDPRSEDGRQTLAGAAARGKRRLRALQVAKGVAARGGHLGFERRNAGNMHQKHIHEQGRAERQPAPGVFA